MTSSQRASREGCCSVSLALFLLMGYGALSSLEVGVRRSTPVPRPPPASQWVKLTTPEVPPLCPQGTAEGEGAWPSKGDQNSIFRLSSSGPRAVRSCGLQVALTVFSPKKNCPRAETNVSRHTGQWQSPEDHRWALNAILPKLRGPKQIKPFVLLSWVC